MAKVILLSQFPLPYSKIGSWTNMYKNYLSGDHQIDYIICQQPETLFGNVNYKIVKDTILLKIRRRIQKYYRLGFIDALEAIIDENKGEKFIIQVVDNYKIVVKIHEMLLKRGVRQNCYIQIFYHGFTPFINLDRYPNFYENMDELVLLTKDSYTVHKNFYHIFPCKVSILPNGIDTNKFSMPTAVQREQLKLEHDHAGKKVFIWCSQDRPKKGLTLILDVWKRIHAANKDTVLLIVGAKRKVEIEGVIFIGKVPNDALPKYYQMSDCYLFPTLCHEGFGLTLVEALNCGCYCIASAYGGVPEVLQYGKYGKLIENPNFISEWETAITEYLSGKELPVLPQKKLYTIEDWAAGMNTIISNAKINLT